MRVRGIALTLVLTALAALALAAAATAGNVERIDSKVRISVRAPAFHGKVESNRHACEVNRKVKLLKRRSGPDRLMGKDHTDEKGRWRVLLDPLNTGTYYAKLKRRAEGTAGTTFICKPDVSRFIVVTEG